MTGRSLPTAMFVLPSKSRRRVQAVPSTDCTALSAAAFEPLLFTGEVRGVCGCQKCACIVDDCQECVLRVSLDDHFGMSGVSCECGQNAICKRISVSFLLKRNRNHLFGHSVYGHQDCDHWSILLCLQEAGSRIGCLAGFVIVTHVCFLSHELGHRRCTKVDVSARHWLAHRGAGTSIATGGSTSSRPSNSRSISSSTGGRS